MEQVISLIISILKLTSVRFVCGPDFNFPFSSKGVSLLRTTCQSLKSPYMRSFLFGDTDRKKKI